MRLVLALAGAMVFVVLVCVQYGSDAVSCRQYPVGETESEIWQVVDMAVTSLEYTTADSKKDLERILAKAYAGPVLTELTTAMWHNRPNDDVIPVEIINRRSVEVFGNDARAEARVYFRDWADESDWYGTGTFMLARLKQGWRVVGFDYDWERRAPGPAPVLI